MWNSFLDWLKIKKCDINWDKESFNIKFLFKKKKSFTNHAKQLMSAIININQVSQTSTSEVLVLLSKSKKCLGHRLSLKQKTNYV